MLLWHLLASLLQRGRRFVRSPAVCAISRPTSSAAHPLCCAAAPPRQGLASALLGGGIVGYVLYDTTHWALHSGRADWMFSHTLKVGAG